MGRDLEAYPSDAPIPQDPVLGSLSQAITQPAVDVIAEASPDSIEASDLSTAPQIDGMSRDQIIQYVLLWWMYLLTRVSGEVWMNLLDSKKEGKKRSEST